MDLFSLDAPEGVEAPGPLADRMRPSSLDDLLGQDDVIGQGRSLRLAIEQDGNTIRMTPVAALTSRTAEDGYGIIKYRGPRVRIQDMDATAALKTPRK